jgi:predicted enzyme related to lactoylglutathione lyase
MQGSVSFIEIGSGDQEQSGRFFAKVFGWEFHPMAQGGGWFQGPSIRVGLQGGDPQPQIYALFEALDLEAAIALVKEAGGEADTPGPELPGFGRFSNCRDPQGIRFGLNQRSVS